MGKSAAATTLAYLLAKRGKRTALVDFDGQGHSSIIYGVKNINKLEVIVNTLLRKVMEDEPLPEPDSYVIKHESGVEVIPSNSQLFTLERNLCNVDFRERILSRYMDTIRDRYQYIIIDCMPQMGTPMINVMMCADSIIVPTQAELLSTQGLAELLRHYQIIRRNSNHKLRIEGILLPIILWHNREGKYIILSGHNRCNAARLAGLSKGLVIIKENLAYEEAVLIVTETNLRQRSFGDMSHSERVYCYYYGA